MRIYSYDDIVSFCHAAGFSPRIAQEAIQMQTVVSLVSAEMGVALIPRDRTKRVFPDLSLGRDGSTRLQLVYAF